MWNSLRSDFSEFVSTVKEDTSHVLSSMDDRLEEDDITPEQEECLRRMLNTETYTTPLPTKADNEEQDDGLDAEEAEQVAAFLETFSIEARTDEIGKLLELYPDSLKVQFETLVPTDVPYNDFWERHFYRCDEERIRDTWEAEEQREMEQRQRAVSQTIGSVTGFLGGAVKNLTATLSEDNQDRPFPRLTSMTKNQAEKAGLFGSRPPFVRNTAVDESVDEDDEDEEEELGWDDEDDDLDESFDRDEVEDEDDDEGDDEQIEFNDAATEKLQEQLKQALEERDQLHATVEMQSQEIATLKQTSPDLQPDEAAHELIKTLKMQLFEKDSELAALRSSMLDDSRVQPNTAGENSDNEMVAKLEKKIADMSEAACANEKEMAALQAALESVRGELAQARGQAEQKQEALETTLAESSLLQSKLESLETMRSESVEAGIKEASFKNEMETLRSEHAAMVDSLALSQSELTTKENFWKDELALVKARMETRESELDAAKQEIELLRERALGLETSLKKAKEQPEATEMQVHKEEEHNTEPEDEVAAELSVDSPDTVSTGVKVDTPAAVEKLQVASGDNEDGDEWDDDW
jgi:murein DD-endopeptidase MepM/ murein hydrolase activator NlpD